MLRIPAIRPAPAARRKVFPRSDMVRSRSFEGDLGVGVDEPAGSLLQATRRWVVYQPRQDAMCPPVPDPLVVGTEEGKPQPAPPVGKLPRTPRRLDPKADVTGRMVLG